MVFCRGCGKQLHATAPLCPHCGATQERVPALSQQGKRPVPWLGGLASVMGALCLLGALDSAGWDRDEIEGFYMAFAIALVAGIYVVAAQRAGRRLAIAGMVMAGVALLLFLGKN